MLSTWTNGTENERVGDASPTPIRRKDLVQIWNQRTGLGEVKVEIKAWGNIEEENKFDKRNRDKSTGLL